MRSSIPALVLAASAVGVHAQELLTDINIISQYWGQVSPYVENPEHQFGVQVAGLPDGCQVEQAHLLQRHAQRFPTGGDDDGGIQDDFVSHISTFLQANPSAHFTGPLAFLNSWEYLLARSYLTGLGAATEFSAGVSFWNRYGRILYNATAGQLAYNATFPNGTARPKPVLRTTGQSRIENSQINWALGFFGPSFTQTPNPTLANANQNFNVVIIPEGGTENNTLASYDSCFNDNTDAVGYMGDDDLFNYLPLYLGNATARMQQYAPAGFKFNYNDTYAMQSICAYESNYLGLGASQFCPLFTLDEWDAFEQTLDMEYFYDYSFGNPTGRAQGIGYLQELLARLQNEYIFSSNSSVNSTLTNNAQDFPLGRPFYADFTHDDIIVSVLTAMSVDYFDAPPNLRQVPPAKNRPFTLSKMTPFGGRLVTEVIGCTSAFPPSLPLASSNRTQYYSGQYGYNAAAATHKFVRLRLNNGIVPLATIANKMCTNSRPDAMCEMGNFLASQADAYELSNYNYACFGNYTIPDPTNGEDYNGSIFA